MFVILTLQPLRVEFDPDPTTAVWRLQVGGLVDHPTTYTYDQIRALPSTMQETTLMCISNYLGGGLMSNAVWKGVSMGALLNAATPLPGAAKILLTLGLCTSASTMACSRPPDPTTSIFIATQ